MQHHADFEGTFFGCLWEEGQTEKKNAPTIYGYYFLFLAYDDSAHQQHIRTHSRILLLLLLHRLFWFLWFASLFQLNIKLRYSVVCCVWIHFAPSLSTSLRFLSLLIWFFGCCYWLLSERALLALTLYTPFKENHGSARHKQLAHYKHKTYHYKRTCTDSKDNIHHTPP